MKILLINPNENKNITEGFYKTAKDFCKNKKRDDIEISAINARSGVAVITNEKEVEQASIATRRLIDEQINYYDAIVICAFSNPGYLEIKKDYPDKIYGMGYETMNMAYKNEGKFAIMTGQMSIVEDTIRQVESYNFQDNFDGVIAVDISYIQTYNNKNETQVIYVNEAKRFLETHRNTKRIILGGAVFTGWAEKLKKELKVEVLDGLETTLESIIGDI